MSPRPHAALRFAQTLPTAPASIAIARHALDPLQERLPDDTWRNLRLLVSEVVTNAVKHVGEDAGDLEVSVEQDDGRVRVCVTDAGPGFTPTERDVEHDLGSGWGLHLVDALSDRWGVERDPSRVWFELRAG